MELDKLDRKILNILLEDSRLSYRKIAKRLKVSVATIMSRVNKLVLKGVIERYTADLNYDLIGYDIKAIIQLRISKGKLIGVEQKIAKHPNVFAVYDTTGEFDAVLVTRFMSRKSLDKFLKHIQTFDFIERTYTSIVLNTIKEKQEKI